MEDPLTQGELFAIVWEPFQYRFRLRANDVIRIEGRLCRVVRVNECAAVVVMNRPRRKFSTRFDKPVSFQPLPVMFRISSDSEIEILNRKTAGPAKRSRRQRASA